MSIQGNVSVFIALRVFNESNKATENRNICLICGISIACVKNILANKT
jgi:hypothetical protein